MGIWEKCKAPCSHCQGLISYKVLTLPYIREGTSLACEQVCEPNLWDQHVSIFKLWPETQEAQNPPPASCYLQATEHRQGASCKSQSWEISSPFLGNAFSGNAKDEHQEWPQRAAPAPEVTQVLSPGLPLSALQFNCTQQATCRISACIRLSLHARATWIP